MLMGLRRTVEPTVEPISTADAKTYLRIDGTDDDALLDLLIPAARDYAEGVLNRALLAQTWELTLPAFPAGTPEGLPFQGIRLPWGRTLAVQSITYLDAADGATVALSGPSSSPAGTEWRENLTSDQGGIIFPPDGESWPDTLAGHPAAVTITFQAGYGATAAAVPPTIRAAILYRLADIYEQRGGADGPLSKVSHGALLPHALRAGGAA